MARRERERERVVRASQRALERWIDNILKAMSGINDFSFRKKTTRGGCNPNVQGYCSAQQRDGRYLKMHVQCSLRRRVSRATLVGEEKSALAPGECRSFIITWHEWICTGLPASIPKRLKYPRWKAKNNSPTKAMRLSKLCSKNSTN